MTKSERKKFVHDGIKQISIDYISVWFERKGKKLIEKIIEKNLDLQSKIGKEIRNAVNKLMKQLETEKKYKVYDSDEMVIRDEKGREFVPFNDSDFQTCLDKIKNEGKQYGGLLYLVQVMGSYYCGLTERNLDIRFEEHITDALKGYISTGGDIEQLGYHKFYDAICTVLKLCYDDLNKLHKELDTYSILGQTNKRHAKINEIYNKIKPFIKKRVNHSFQKWKQISTVFKSTCDSRS